MQEPGTCQGVWPLHRDRGPPVTGGMPPPRPLTHTRAPSQCKGKISLAETMETRYRVLLPTSMGSIRNMGTCHIMIHPRYEDAFRTLTTEELDCILEGIVPTHPEIAEIEVFSTGMELVDYCRSAHISQAEIIMAIRNDTRVVAVSAVERIMLRPVDRRTPAQVGADREALNPRPIVAPVPASDITVDDRIIRVLSDTNPKRAGTKSHDLWRLYRDGETIASYMRRGGTRAALQWDQERGYVRIERAP